MSDMLGESDGSARPSRRIDLGVDAAATLATAGLASLDPTLALVGGPLARTVARAGGDVLQRLLSHRQRDRTITVLDMAIHRVHERQQAGEQVRNDGFFNESDSGDGRAGGSEVLEALLLAAGSTAQERKLRHIAAFYASLAFIPEIGAEYAAFLLTQAEQLTYRQLILLSILAGGDRQRELLEILYASRGTAGRILFGEEVSVELNDVQTRGLAGVGQPGGQVTPTTGTFGGGEFSTVAVENGTLTRHGRTLHDLMELDGIPVDERVDALAGAWSVAPPAQP